VVDEGVCPAGRPDAAGGIAAEMRAIHEAFPDLKRQAPGAKGNGRRKMTAAQKKLISEKMRAAWARRKSKEKR
jgi:hypothetical protein